MEWLIFAFFGTLFFSAAGVLDKLLLSGYTTGSKAYVVCQILAQQVFTVPVILMLGTGFLYPSSLYALLFGCLQVIPALFYLRALQVEEASRVTALEHVYPVFVFAGSFILLGEVLETKHYAGVLLLLAGALLLSFRGAGRDLLGGLRAISPAIRPFLSYWIFTALYYIGLKYLLISIDEWDLYAWSSLGSLVAILPLMAVRSVRHDVACFFARGGPAIVALLSEETCQFLGIILSLFAYALGSAALVSSVGALQPMLTVLMVLLIGALSPRLSEALSEMTDRRSLAQKAFCFMIMVLGIYFVS